MDSSANSIHPKIYRTKYDLWILAILLAATIAGGFAAVSGFVSEPFPINAISLGIMGLLVAIGIRIRIGPVLTINSGGAIS